MNPIPTESPYAPPRATVADRPRGRGPLRTASPWSRLAAVVVNQVLWSVALLPVLVVEPGLILDEDPPPLDLTGSVVGALTATAVLCGALSVFQLVLVHQGGWTVGKRLLGIRVVRPDGRRAGIGRIVVLREVVYPLLIAFASVLTFGLAWILVLVDALMVFRRDGRTLHDQVAGTRVVVADEAA